MTPGGYDFWLFDLDGTLVDIEPWYPKAVIGRIGDELGVEFSDHEVAVLWYGVGGSRNDYLEQRSVSPERFWQVFHEIENPQARANATYLYDDAAAYVEAIDAPIGLVTHCQRYLTDPVLDELGIRDWFDAVVCCSDATGWKPDPDPVDRLLRLLDVDAERDDGVLIGDDPVDVGAANAVDLDAVRILRDPVTDAAVEPNDGGVATTEAVDAATPNTGADAVAATDGGEPTDGQTAADREDPADPTATLEARHITSFTELS